MYEYKVVPAPTRAGKIKGLKTTAERFAHSLAERINAEAAGGWRFLRTESLACEERRGLTGTSRSTQTVMIFARALGQTRPHAGAALAAAQEGLDAYLLSPADEAAPPGYSGRRDETGRDGMFREPIAAPRSPETRSPELRTSESRLGDPAIRRQEPLFRSGAMLRSEQGARSEPVLRPRPPQETDER